MELYKAYRPKRLKDVVGQLQAVAQLEKLLERGLPHTLTFSGPPGTGKTTLARILRRRLGCEPADYEEVDCAALESPLDTVRSIKRRMALRPIAGPCRIWFIEEAQALSRAVFCQQALLKMLEDTPEHVYFFLATTDPGKLLPAIRSRATEIALTPLPVKALQALVKDVMTKESMNGLADETIALLCKVADGSARKALVVLEQVAGLGDDAAVRAGIEAVDTRSKSDNLARLLLNRKTSWQHVAPALKALDDDPEQVRRQVLGYAAAVLQNGRADGRAYSILICFEKPFWESGKAGLTRACYEVLASEE